MARSRPLIVEHLEDRVVPSLMLPGDPTAGAGTAAPQAVFGTPWPDASRLSLSFAPDGTTVDGQASALFSTLSAMPSSAWKTEIIRAFQTWAVNANINIGLVGDGGQAFGVSGAIEGDSRFGDIRVGARFFDTHIADNSPYNVLSNTRAGDVLLNSNTAFGIGDPDSIDLFSSMLNEAGNIFGLGDNVTDPTSGLYSFYDGVRTGLNAADVTAIQTLYGARKADASEGLLGNNSVFTATSINTNSSIFADITTLSDVDYYRFTMPSNVQGDGHTFSVRVKASEVSFLTPRLTVTNLFGRTVAAAVTTDPLDNTLVVQINNATPGSVYYIKVQGARQDVFGIGGYRLRVYAGPAADMPAGVANNDFSQSSVLNDAHTNDTLDTATSLDRSAYQSDTRFDVRAQAVISDATDVDYYQFVAPTTSQGSALVVTAWALQQGGVTPTLTVYDQYGAQVNADVLVKDSGNTVLQVANATAGATYYVGVSGANGSTGTYEMTADFGKGAPVLQSAGVGELNASTMQSFRTLNSLEGQVFHFVLNSTADAGVETAVLMTIYDANNNVVFSMMSKNGETVSGNIYLAAGSYTVRFEAGARDGRALPSLFYDLRAVNVTDPIDPMPVDPTAIPVGVTVPTFSWMQYDSAYYSFLDSIDPYSNPWLGF